MHWLCTRAYLDEATVNKVTCMKRFRSIPYIGDLSSDSDTDEHHKQCQTAFKTFFKIHLKEG